MTTLLPILGPTLLAELLLKREALAAEVPSVASLLLRRSAAAARRSVRACMESVLGRPRPRPRPRPRTDPVLCVLSRRPSELLGRRVPPPLDCVLGRRVALLLSGILSTLGRPRPRPRPPRPRDMESVLERRIGSCLPDAVGSLLLRRSAAVARRSARPCMESVLGRPRPRPCMESVLGRPRPRPRPRSCGSGLSACWSLIGASGDCGLVGGVGESGDTGDNGDAGVVGEHGGDAPSLCMFPLTGSGATRRFLRRAVMLPLRGGAGETRGMGMPEPTREKSLTDDDPGDWACSELALVNALGPRRNRSGRSLLPLRHKG